MSLQLNWKSEELPIEMGDSPWSRGDHISCLAHLEEGIGYQSVVSVTMIIDGSAGSIPAYKWKLNASTGELINREVVGWREAGFNEHFYDPSESGRYWSLGVYSDVSSFNPGTWTRGDVSFSTFPISWPAEPDIWMIDMYGMIYDRGILLGRDTALYQDQVGMYDINSQTRLGWFKSATSTGTQKVFPTSHYDGYVMTPGGIITPTYFEQGATPGRSLRIGNEVPHVARCYCIDPVTHSALMFNVGLDAANGRTDAKVYSFSLRSSPRHVSTPFPLRMPRSGRDVELVSQVISDDGRLASNWPFTQSEVGDGSVKVKTHTSVTNSSGLARVELDTTASGGYSQDVTISAEHGEVL